MATLTREEILKTLVTLVIDVLGVDVEPEQITEALVMQDAIPDSVARSDLLTHLRRRYRITKEVLSDQDAKERLAGQTVAVMIDIVLEKAA